MASSCRDLLKYMAEHLSWQIINIRLTSLFFKVDQWSAASLESSCRDLLKYMSEHRSISTNNRNTPYSLFSKVDDQCSSTSLKSSCRGLLKYCTWLNMGLLWQIIEVRLTPLFSKVDQCSSTSMESSCRDVLKYMAEHRSILTNNRNTPYSLIFQGRPLFSHIIGKLLPRPVEVNDWT